MRTDNALSYAVRLRVVLKYLGQLAMLAALLTAVPLLASVAWGEYAVTARYAAAAALLGGPGWLASRLQAPKRLQRNEALAIAGGIFVITSLVMTIPMMGAGLSFVDAWFESVSAVTTTGLSTIETTADKPQTFLFARAWMQWYGGLGIVVLSLGLAIQPGVVARRLALTQTEEEDIIGSTHTHARRIFTVYALITLAAIAALWFAGATPLDAVNHAFAAVSTGGFSTHDDSLASFPVAAQSVIILVGLLGSVSLSLYWFAGQNALGRLLRDPQLWTLIGCVTLGSGALFAILFMHGEMPWPQALRHAVLNAASAQSTAGFSTMSLGELDPTAQWVMIGSMAVGGATESTAGGFKLLRLLVIAYALRYILFETSLAKHAVDSPSLGQHKLEPQQREAAMAVVILFTLVTFLSWLPFVIAGYDPMNALFEVVSATGTVGLSSGVTAPGLPTPLKLVLCADMLLGRLEFFAILVLLYPRTWAGERMRWS